MKNNRMLLKRTILTVAMILVLSLTVSANIYRDEGRYYCHAKRIEGDVLVQRANEADVMEVMKNMPFMAGDRLWTNAVGRIQMQMTDGTIVSLDNESKLDFEALGEDVDNYPNTSVLKLWAGSVYLNLFTDLDNESNLRIETLTGYISILNKGSYRIDVAEDYSITVTVFKGLVEVGNNEGSSMVRSDQRLFLEPGEIPGEPVMVASADRYDDFNEWVAASVTRYSSSVSSRYVDDSLDYLVDEMDDYGEWKYYDEYDSYVWVPSTTYVNVGWRPYYNGQWVWTPHGWSFVSYDPWGWITYRYGRWDYSPWGWSWIPGYRYSPSWVYWEIGHNYIGWAPLGYYNNPVNKYWYKQYPRGYKPKPGKDGRWEVDNDSWTFVKKTNFGTGKITKSAMAKTDINNLDRSQSKTIAVKTAEKGFTDKKITYRKSSSTTKNPSYSDLPAGTFKQVISKKSPSYSSTYKSGSKSTTTKSYQSKSSPSTSTSKSSSYYNYLKKGSSKSSTKYYTKSDTNKSGSSKSSSSTSSGSKYKSSPSKSSSSTSSKSYKSKSSTSSSSSSSTKSKSNSSTSSSTSKKKDGGVNLSYSNNNYSNAYRSSERYAASKNINTSKRYISKETANRYKNDNKTANTNNYKYSHNNSRSVNTKNTNNNYNKSSYYNSYSKNSYKNAYTSKYKNKSYPYSSKKSDVNKSQRSYNSNYRSPVKSSSSYKSSSSSKSYSSSSKSSSSSSSSKSSSSHSKKK